MTSETSRSGGSPFRRNVAATSVGLAVAQGGQLALLIPISRVFDPESLGLFGAFAAVVIVAAACSTARFEMAIPTSRSARERRALVVLCGVMATAVGIVAAAICTLAGMVEESRDAMGERSRSFVRVHHDRHALAIGMLGAISLKSEAVDSRIWISVVTGSPRP